MRMTRKISGVSIAVATALAAVGVPKVASAEEIYMIRGAMNVFSRGMDQMTNRLRARGCNAKDLSNGQWQAVARDIIKRNQQGAVSFPIVISGHSVGGQEAPRFSDTLAKAGIPVALVVGVDPGWLPPPPFTEGAPRVVNFWVGNSARGNPYKSGGNFSGNIVNIDIRAFSSADHVQIDKDPSVQARIIEQIVGAAGC